MSGLTRYPVGIRLEIIPVRVFAIEALINCAINQVETPVLHRVFAARCPDIRGY